MKFVEEMSADDYVIEREDIKLIDIGQHKEYGSKHHVPLKEQWKIARFKDQIRSIEIAIAGSAILYLIARILF